jgi:uncharacterized protein (TIGR02231 family)
MKPLFAMVGLSAAAIAQAQTSSISQVLLYPGGAEVERVLRLPAGATQARFACLPALLERESLQLQAGPGVALGELQVEQLPREQLPECLGASPKLRELEGRRAALEAEQGGVDVSLAYLRNLSDREAKPGAGLGASVDALRRQAQELLSRQQALKQQMAALELELQAAKRAAPPDTGPVTVVQLRLAAAQATDLKLSYRIRNAGWQPQYRARLDTASAAVVLERRALVAQGSGEDWSDVKLRLSTTQPRLAVAPSALPSWTLGIAPPIESAPVMAKAFAPPPPPPPAPAQRVEVTGARVNFDASVFAGEFATEYALPQAVTLRGNGQELNVSLGQQVLEGRLVSRIQPQQEAQAYLVAEVARPAGSWPAGTLQLFRDGSYVGQTQLRLGSLPLLDLFFGRDERLRVRVEPEQRDGADTGLIGTRRERVLTRAWQIENLRAKPITLQVLEAAPVSEHEDIRVQTQFSPAVSQAGWREQTGLQLWELSLPAGQTQAFKAVYRISVPKDARVTGWR